MQDFYSSLGGKANDLRVEYKYFLEVEQYNTTHRMPISESLYDDTNLKHSCSTAPRVTKAWRIIEVHGMELDKEQIL